MTIWFRRCASFEEEAEADREYWQQYTPAARVAELETLRLDWAQMTNDGSRPTSDHSDFLAALARHGARVLVVGAHALAFHAKPRYTKDLDLFIEPSAENEARVLALHDFGFGEIGVREGDLAVPGRIVQLGFPPNRIDLMTSIDGLTFADAWDGRVEGDFAGQRVFFIGKAELIRNKAASGRAQDLADLELLRRF